VGCRPSGLLNRRPARAPFIQEPSFAIPAAVRSFPALLPATLGFQLTPVVEPLERCRLDCETPDVEPALSRKQLDVVV
jgi:hypothetical protein